MIKKTFFHKPRTSQDLCKKYGIDFKRKIPKGTNYSFAWTKHGWRLFYWIPTYTKAQAKQLAILEIDIANAKET